MEIQILVHAAAFAMFFMTVSPCQGAWKVECGDEIRNCFVVQEQSLAPSRETPFTFARTSFSISKNGNYIFTLILKTVPVNGKKIAEKSHVTLNKFNLNFAGCVDDCLWFFEMPKQNLDEFFLQPLHAYTFVLYGSDEGVGFDLPIVGLSEALVTLNRNWENSRVDR